MHIKFKETLGKKKTLNLLHVRVFLEYFIFVERRKLRRFISESNEKPFDGLVFHQIVENMLSVFEYFSLGIKILQFLEKFLFFRRAVDDRSQDIRNEKILRDTVPKFFMSVPNRIFRVREQKTEKQIQFAHLKS